MSHIWCIYYSCGWSYHKYIYKSLGLSRLFSAQAHLNKLHSRLQGSGVLVVCLVPVATPTFGKGSVMFWDVLDPCLKWLFTRRRFVLGVNNPQAAIDLFWREAKRCSVRRGAFPDHKLTAPSCHHKTILDRQERKTQSFRVDNGFLKADSIGLGLRKSKDMKVRLGEDQWTEDESGPNLSTLQFGWVSLLVSMAVERWPGGLVAQRSGSMGKSPDGPWWGRWLVTRCDLKIFHVVMVTWLLGLVLKWNPFTDIRIICIVILLFVEISQNLQLSRCRNWWNCWNKKRKQQLQFFRPVISGGLGVPSLLRVWHPGAQSRGHRGRVPVLVWSIVHGTGFVSGEIQICHVRKPREHRNWADFFLRAPLSGWWMFGALSTVLLNFRLPQHGLCPGRTKIASLLK